MPNDNTASDKTDCQSQQTIHGRISPLSLWCHISSTPHTILLAGKKMINYALTPSSLGISNCFTVAIIRARLIKATLSHSIHSLFFLEQRYLMKKRLDELHQHLNTQVSVVPYFIRLRNEQERRRHVSTFEVVS